MATIMMEALLMAAILMALFLDVAHTCGQCYMETCSIGTEYCDEIEERCSPCSLDVCQLYTVPTACQHICSDADSFSWNSTHSAVAGISWVLSVLFIVVLQVIIIKLLPQRHRRWISQNILRINNYAGMPEDGQMLPEQAVRE